MKAKVSKNTELTANAPLSWLNLNISSRWNNKSHLASLDYWRSIAILLVVFWHFFPVRVGLGVLGVQVFFVLSGFLVSRTLVQSYLEKKTPQLKDFWLARFFRIIPSYYGYLIFGSLFALAFLATDEQNILISSPDLLSYLFLYKNYNTSAAQGFGHLWSLCVEEHFYLFLPLLFLLFNKNKKLSTLLVVLVALLGLEIVIRFIGLTRFFEQQGIFFSDPASTHNNFDSLIYGVLIRVAYEKRKLLSGYFSFIIFICGLAILVTSVYYTTYYRDPLYFVVFAKASNAIGISLMIWATLKHSLSILTPLRFLAFYSYNWYLWHPLSIMFIKNYVGEDVLAFILYLLTSLSLAMLSTHLIELNAYKLRKKSIKL